MNNKNSSCSFFNKKTCDKHFFKNYEVAFVFPFHINFLLKRRKYEFAKYACNLKSTGSPT